MPAPEATVRAAVIGAAGYAGGEVLRLLFAHPFVASVRAYSASHAGEPLGAVHPALAHLTGDTMREPDPAAAAGESDVVFLAMPHGRAQSLIGALLAREPKLVIDLSADFRIHDPALHHAHYGEHHAPLHRTSFVYGLADVAGTALAGATRIAAPGCFATATLLALHPFARAGLIEGVPTCVAATGSSGAGVEWKRSTHHPVRAHNYFAYSLAGHRHEGEIDEHLRRATGDPHASCRLLTHSAPLVRGIHATVTIPLARAVSDPLALIAEYWSSSHFVRVTRTPPELAAVVGTNFAHVYAAPRDSGRTAIAVAVIDNLVKGAAGQAVQAMNLALALPERAGLDFPGIYPC